MRHSFLWLFLALGLFTNAQNWEPLNYNADQAGLERNPLKGFVDLFQPVNDFPRSIEARLFGLDEIMLGIDDFNWTVIDNFLAEQASAGRHCYVQVNIDPANGSTNMPAFLLDQVAFESFPGDTQNPPDLCPDWNDPELMAAMLNFIERFGARYNDDPRLFMVHLGLYGMWGEWHIGIVENIRPEFEMTGANKTLIANAYESAFPDKVLLARYPENMPNPQQFGYSDGLFFGESISELEAQHHYYFHNTLKAYNADLNWQLHPVGGEIDPALQPLIWQNWPNTVGQDVRQCFDLIHPSWLFSHHIFTDLPTNTTEWNNAIRAQKEMGYTFYIDQYRITAADAVPIIEINVRNTGVAPMYANWDVEFAVLDADQQLQSLGVAKLNLDIVQPGVLENYRSFMPETNLADGTYTFMLRVVNPLEALSANAPTLRFANTTQDVDRDGWLTLGQQTINTGQAGEVPTAVSSLELSPASATLVVGEQIQLEALVSPQNATNQTISWVSSQPGTASVDANGQVHAGPAYGDVTIYAYTQDGGLVEESVLRIDPFRVKIPALIEAEDFIRMSGVVVENNNSNLGYIDNSDWMDYGVIVNEAANFHVDFRVSSPTGSGDIQLLDREDNILAVIQVPDTDAWGTYATVSSASFTLPAGIHDLRVRAAQGGFNMDWLEFVFESTTATKEAGLSSALQVYPNPAKNSLTISWGGPASNTGIDQVKILDPFGTYRTTSVSDTGVIDFSAYPAGVYFLEVEVDGKRVTKKVVKQ